MSQSDLKQVKFFSTFRSDIQFQTIFGNIFSGFPLISVGLTFCRVTLWRKSDA